MSEATLNIIRTITGLVLERWRSEGCMCKQCTTCKTTWALESAVDELLRLQESAGECSLLDRFQLFIEAVKADAQWYNAFKLMFFGGHGPNDIREAADAVTDTFDGDEEFQQLISNTDISDVISLVGQAAASVISTEMSKREAATYNFLKTMRSGAMGVGVGANVPGGAPNKLFEAMTGAPVFAFKKEHEDAVLPEYAHDGDSGMDVRTVETVTIGEGTRMLVRTGLSCSIPEGWELQVRSRSGMTIAEGLMVMNSPGTIDSGFRGEIHVILFRPASITTALAPTLDRTPDGLIIIPKGTKIAQLVPARVHRVVSQWASNDHSKTARDKGMFGSTGT